VTRDGLFKALERFSRAVGYSDDEDYDVQLFLAVVVIVCLVLNALMYPLDGVLVP
jgi:hypothetical protein